SRSSVDTEIRRSRSGADTETRRSRSIEDSEGRRSRSGRGSGAVNNSRRGGEGESQFDPKLIIIAAAAVLLVIVLIVGIKSLIGKGTGTGGKSASEAETTVEETVETIPDETEPARDYIGEAKLMYAQYDYDNAVELLKSMPDYDSNTEAQALAKQCEDTKATCVEQNLKEITHVFFHILCVDPVNSFDESRWGKQAGGYNSLMTTIDEFKAMMQEMYDKGYVIVSLHDMSTFTNNADGTVTRENGHIMLPPGKKAFVMSEDDVCYYEYMKGAGYADKMIIGEDGRPTLHYTDKDGNEFVGDYDLLGVLDTFIDEHPDFSYRGHKACLVFTGYNGILGYRTDESYDPNSEYYDPSLEQGHDVQAERAEAVEVLKAIIADGYDVGSHSWGHRDLGQIEMDRFTKDCDRWERNVAPLIREATGEQPDIIIYPKGADIADWHGYSHDNERFNYLRKLGFRYFCNVDSSQYWVQLGDDYLRQGRRALDGYNMWLDIGNGYTRLSDLFDNVSAIFDSARPTPVPSY
ncbi:MAG: polysaccharide deacetylase family protein, partial [Eubacteriales bacterium]|nr:polysaccharide deacetylase family protein [Eubacteriales bacterium]